MVVAHANLVLGAYHAARLHAAKLRLLDLKFLVAVIENASQVGNDNLLSCCHIGGAADNLGRLFLAQVHRADVHVVRVRMRLTSQNLSNVETLQASLYCLYFL